MARKNLLKGLIGDSAAPAPAASAVPSPTPAPAPAELVRPRYAKGAIGAVGQSIADLKSRALVDIDPALIEAGGLHDRLEHDDEAHAALVGSIRAYGQQVPVLLRPHPDKAGRYQIVYGRRRVRAIRDLGQTVKAIIRTLDESAAIIAQGQENTARRDLSFIEKANFARQMRDLGYERRVICDALHIDKTVISRMLSVVDGLPYAVIEAIGSAPSIGRDRWLQLAERVKAAPGAADSIPALLDGAPDLSSDARFEAVLAHLAAPKKAAPPAPAPMVLKTADGRSVGRAQRSAGKMTLILETRAAAGFEDWLVENFEDLHKAWQSGQRG
ncbi:MAG: plasmid partitioning protein RepB [Pseudomonadota bacterium]